MMYYPLSSSSLLHLCNLCNLWIPPCNLWISSSSAAPWIILALLAFAAVLVHTLYRLYRRRVEMERGLSLENEGRLEEAVAVFERAMRRDKADAISLFHLGLCRELMGDVDRAREAYELVADDPRCDFAAKVRLRELAQGKRLDQQKLCALDLFERGVALLARGDIAEAEDAFNEGAAMHPAYKPVHYYLGVCAEINGRAREAIQHYERLASEGDDPTLGRHRILAARAHKLWNTGQARQAIRLRKAWNYLEIEMADRAAFEFGELLRDCPDEYTAYFGLARCNALNGDLAAARECYRQVPPDDWRYEDAQQKLKEMMNDER